MIKKNFIRSRITIHIEIDDSGRPKDRRMNSTHEVEYQIFFLYIFYPFFPCVFLFCMFNIKPNLKYILYWICLKAQNTRTKEISKTNVKTHWKWSQSKFSSRIHSQKEATFLDSILMWENKEKKSLKSFTFLRPFFFLPIKQSNLLREPFTPHLLAWIYEWMFECNKNDIVIIIVNLKTISFHDNSRSEWRWRRRLNDDETRRFNPTYGCYEIWFINGWKEYQTQKRTFIMEKSFFLSRKFCCLLFF